MHQLHRPNGSYCGMCKNETNKQNREKQRTNVSRIASHVLKRHEIRSDDKLPNKYRAQSKKRWKSFVIHNKLTSGKLYIRQKKRTKQDRKKSELQSAMCLYWAVAIRQHRFWLNSVRFFSLIHSARFEFEQICLLFSAVLGVFGENTKKTWLIICNLVENVSKFNLIVFAKFVFFLR